VSLWIGIQPKKVGSGGKGLFANFHKMVVRNLSTKF
jgi:hypothetical protein